MATSINLMVSPVAQMEKNDGLQAGIAINCQLKAQGFWMNWNFFLVPDFFVLPVSLDVGNRQRDDPDLWGMVFVFAVLRRRDR